MRRYSIVILSVAVLGAVLRVQGIGLGDSRIAMANSVGGGEWTYHSGPPRDSALTNEIGKTRATWRFENSDERMIVELENELVAFTNQRRTGMQGSYTFVLTEPAYFSLKVTNRWQAKATALVNTYAHLYEYSPGFDWMPGDPEENLPPPTGLPPVFLFRRSDATWGTDEGHMLRGPTEAGGGFMRPGKYGLAFASAVAEGEFPEGSNPIAMRMGVYLEVFSVSEHESRRALGEAIEFPVEGTGGASRWLPTGLARQGEDAARCELREDAGSSYLTSSVEGPGVLSFWVKTEGTKVDFLEFSIDGEEKIYASGETDWHQRFWRIPAGWHELRWVYTKNSTAATPSASAWLDEVVFVPGTNGWTKVDQSIRLVTPGPVRVFHGAERIDASASSFLPVSFEVVSGAAEFRGSTLVAFEKGPVRIRVSQRGDEIFHAASPVEGIWNFETEADTTFLAANLSELNIESRGRESYSQTVRALAFQPDGKLIVAGNFAFAGGERRWNIARYNPDMTLDPGWKPRIVSLDIVGVAVFGDELIVAGTLVEVNGVRGLGRLAKISLIDGSVDEQWKPAPDGYVFTIHPVGNQLIVGGGFHRIGGVERRYVAKVDVATGKVDELWNPGPNSVVGAIAVREGSVYLGGPFSEVRGFPSASLAKVSLDGAGDRDPNWLPRLHNPGVGPLVALPTRVFAAGHIRTNQLAGVGLASFSVFDGSLQSLHLPDRSANLLKEHENDLYIGFWIGGFARLSFPDLTPTWIGMPARFPVTTTVIVNDVAHRGKDLILGGHFESYNVSLGGCIAYIPTLEGAPVITAGAMTRDRLSGPVRLVPHPSDALETTHFEITDVENGVMYLLDSKLESGRLALTNGAMVSKANAATELRFMPDPGFFGTGRFKARGSKTSHRAGAGGPVALGTIQVLEEPLDQTISISTIPDTYYDVKTVRLNVSSSSKNPITFTIAGPARLTNETELHLEGVGSVSVIAFQAGDELYKPSLRVGAFFNVWHGRQTVQFSPNSEARLDTRIPLSSTASSGLGAVYSVLSGPGTITDGVLTFTGTGEVIVRAHHPGNHLWGDAFVDRKVLVRGRVQTILFPAVLAGRFDAGPVRLQAAASSGLPVTYRLLSGKAELEGNRLQAKGAGAVMVEAMAAANAEFDSVAAQQTIVFGRATQTVSFDWLPQLAVSNVHRLRAVASSELPVKFEANAPVGSVNGDVLTVHRPGILVVSASQEGNEDYEPTAVAQARDIPHLEQFISIDFLPTLTFGMTNVPIVGRASSGLPIKYEVTGAATIAGNLLSTWRAGGVEITASQAGNVFYAPVSLTFNVYVSPALQTIEWLSPTNLQAQQTHPLFVKATSGEPVKLTLLMGDATLTGTNLQPHSPGRITIHVRQVGNSNYYGVDHVQELAVGFPIQTLDFNAATNRTFQDGNVTFPTRTHQNQPLTWTMLSGPARIAGNTLIFLTVGTVRVRATALGDSQYAHFDREFVFRVEKSPQTIEFPPIPDKRVSDRAVALEATASSGLPVQFTVTGPVFTEGNLIHLSRVGTVVVQARQTGNEQFMIAPVVERSFNVLKGTQTISFPPIPPVRFEGGAVPLKVTASSGRPVEFEVSGPGEVQGGALMATAAGEVRIIARQPGDGNFDPATPVEQSIRVEKAFQQIQFAPPAEWLIEAGGLKLDASSDSGLNVGLVVLSGPALLRGSELEPLEVGVVSLLAFQPGDANHEPAQAQARTVQIKRREPPQLSVAATEGFIVIAWPLNRPGFKLQHSAEMSAWTDVETEPIITGDHLAITFPTVHGARYYRLASEKN